MIRYLFLLSILITPFTTILDSLFWTLLGERTEIISPMWIRLLDEVLISILFVLLLFKTKANFAQIYEINKIYFVFILLLMITIIYSLLFNPILVVLSGLKWAIYLFLLGLFFYLEDKDKKFIHENIIWILIAFLYLNLLFQLVQLVSFSYYFSNTFFGLSQRTIGFFREPNALAFFNIISFYYIYIYMKDNIHKKMIIFFILPLSIVLTGSMTAIFALILIIIFLNIRINIKYLLYSIIIIGFIFYFLAPYIPSRPGLENSILIRLDIILNHINLNNILFSTIFGFGTNTAVLLKESTLIPESNLAEFLINIGVIGTIFFYLLFIDLLQSEKGKLFFIVVLIMSLTNSIISAYPINLLIVFEFSCLLAINKKKAYIEYFN